MSGPVEGSADQSALASTIKWLSNGTSNAIITSKNENESESFSGTVPLDSAKDFAKGKNTNTVTPSMRGGIKKSLPACRYTHTVLTTSGISLERTRADGESEVHDMESPSKGRRIDA